MSPVHNINVKTADNPSYTPRGVYNRAGKCAEDVTRYRATGVCDMYWARSGKNAVRPQSLRTDAGKEERGSHLKCWRAPSRARRAARRTTGLCQNGSPPLEPCRWSLRLTRAFDTAAAAAAAASACLEISTYLFEMLPRGAAHGRQACSHRTFVWRRRTAFVHARR